MDQVMWSKNVNMKTDSYFPPEFFSERKIFNSVVGIFFFSWFCPWRAELSAEQMVSSIIHICGVSTRFRSQRWRVSILLSAIFLDNRYNIPIFLINFIKQKLDFYEKWAFLCKINHFPTWKKTNCYFWIFFEKLMFQRKPKIVKS